MEPLLPIRHENQDFFVCDIFDALPCFKDDMASMEHPVFSLSTKPDMRVLHYEHNGNTITIKPSYDGLPTIHDKDVLLYCASYLRAAIARGHTPSRTLRFTALDLLVSTNRLTNGRSYERFKAALERLSGTRIQTNIKTGGLIIEEGFGLIDAWRAVKEDKDGRVIAAEIKLSDWFYNAILSNELLTISRDYFRLRKPIERRIYELARKHCGDDPSFKIGLAKLHKKTGSSSTLREFRRLFGRLLQTDHLPDYAVSMDADMVTFTNRNRKLSTDERQIGFPFLKPETFTKARAAAPGWDVYHLEQEWREWIAKKEPTKRPDAAFVAFCRKRFQTQGRP
ncbi:MAG: RepB family plasmid replication initiator protein [Candidatus Competibacteraceae bacterium]|jgi:plasmid replication initiation protein|nr:MAG: RepB family plasmid replication initiator protein [Candidatus Competibacteraceae bacterium]